MSLKLGTTSTRAALVVFGMLACACGDAGTRAESRSESVAAAEATLTPNTDLIDGQEVTLRLQGIIDGDLTAVALCRPVPEGTFPSLESCGTVVRPGVSVNGVIETSFRIPASIDGINCQLEACVLYVESGWPFFPDFAIHFRALVPVSFRSVGEPPPAPPLSVTPNTALADRQQVSVRGTGFMPNLFMTVGQCRVGAQSFNEDCMALTTPSPVRANAAGEVETPLAVRYRVEPSAGEAFDCSDGACVVVALPTRAELDLAEAGRAPIAFDIDTNPGPVQRGVLELDRSSVTSGDTILVSGSGWAPRATLRLNQCSSQALGVCGPETSIQVAADGTFTASVIATRLLVEPGINGPNHALSGDCASPSTCALRAFDPRDRAATQVSAPLAVAARPGVSAALDLRGPLFPDMSVRLVGSGFTPNDSVDLWQCGQYVGAVCKLVGRIPTDASGNVRGYSRLVAYISVFVVIECARADSTCDLRITDGPGAVTLPLRFAAGDVIQVTSNYEAKWQPLLEQGLDVSGAAPAELQRQGASVLLWVMAASGAPSAAHFPVTGSVSYTTTYPPQTYIDMTNLAASYDYTLDELQKSGMLFWSWVLAGRPPLPAAE